MAKSASLENLDRRYVWHPFTQHYAWDREPVLIIDSGHKNKLTDIYGRTYLDAVSSLWVNLVGHGHPVMNRALKKQIDKISHSTFLGLSHRPAIELAKALSDVAPGKLTRSFYSDNGAGAVEVAIKMAFQFFIEKKGQRRREFLAVRGSYHGDTLGAVSVGGIGAFHSKFKPLLFKTNFASAPACFRCPFNKKKTAHRFRTGEIINHTPRPGQDNNETGCRWQCLKDVESQLQRRSKTTAALIIEPIVQGAIGMNVQPPGYLAALRHLCSQYGVFLIADEVATGFCRTGTLFACEQEQVQPDLLCLAKSITGGYSPLAVTMTTENFFRAFYAPISQGRTFFHGHSYTAHPLGAVAALANLKLIKSMKLLEKTRRLAQVLKDELQDLIDLQAVGSIRQAGLMVGIELVQDKTTMKPIDTQKRVGARLCRALLDDGIWMRPLGNTLVLMPAPIIRESELRFLVRSVKKGILRETQT